jgi:hypothetical protein
MVRYPTVGVDIPVSSAGPPLASSLDECILQMVLLKAVPWAIYNNSYRLIWYPRGRREFVLKKTGAIGNGSIIAMEMLMSLRLVAV